MKLFGTKQAAKYIGISPPTLKYHIAEGNINPRKIGHALVFTKQELDQFIATRRKPGRPRKEHNNDVSL